MNLKSLNYKAHEAGKSRLFSIIGRPLAAATGVHGTPSKSRKHRDRRISCQILRAALTKDFSVPPGS